MPSPFPGMDPYLEHPKWWPEIHQLLYGEFLRVLRPLLRPRYVAQLNTRLTIGAATVVPDVSILEPSTTLEFSAGQPAAIATTITPVSLELDVQTPVREISLEIRTADDERLITAIELLSPTNKDPYDSRYQQKRQRILRSSDAHLLEIDLLRAGRRSVAHGELLDSPYIVLLNRANQRARYQVWTIALPDPLPVVPVPLLEGDTDIALDLGAALTSVYDHWDYIYVIDYTTDLDPPLSDEDAAWAAALLREKGLRS